MIKVYETREGMLSERVTQGGSLSFDNTIWIDISNPSQEESWLIENHFNVSIPNQVEIDEIEISRRLYSEGNTHYLTAYILSTDSISYFQSNSVRFIMFPSFLITVRYAEMPLFNEANHLVFQQEKQTAEQILISLLKSAIYHFGDVLEQIGFNIDLQTKEILNAKNDAYYIKNDFRIILQNIGKNGDVTAKAREGLISINSLITYITQDHVFGGILKNQMSTMTKDINALNDHTFFLSNQINFLLEATLGMINIEQNAAIKVFSIASMMFLPPTLIASIYGMNFANLPGLHSKYGFLFAFFFMGLASLIPYKYFKRRGWM